MPNCFQLRKKDSRTPEKLSAVDDAICAHLGVEVHPTKYHASWYDFIGFHIALGKKLGGEELQETVSAAGDETWTKILSFLEETYSSDAWVEIGRRRE